MVTAAGAIRTLGVRSARCRLEPSVRARSHASLNQILPALVLLRKPLFGLAKRQLPRTLSASYLKLWVKYG